MRDSFTLVRNDDAGGNIAIDIYTGENVEFITGTYPIPLRQYPVQQPGQCDCGEYHNGQECWNTVREDDDSWQLTDWYINE